MYTQESNYKEMVAKAKELGIETKNIKKVDLIEALNAAISPKVERRGRPVNPDSPRQKRLSQKGLIGRGRPTDPNSAWNIKQAALAAKREACELKLGRPVNPESTRQARLAKVGTVKRGRPVLVKTEPAVEITTEPATV